MNGKPAARVGDMHTCPMSDGPKPHIGGPVLPPGKPTVMIGGMPAATITDLCACLSVPDIIMEGAKTVIINGLPASRQFDRTVHGGYISMGCTSVLIGGPSLVDESLLRFRPEEDEGPSLFKLGLTIVLDFIPIIGTAKGIYEGVVGHDAVTGEELSVAERLIGWVPFFGKLGRGVKNGKKIKKSFDSVGNVVKESPSSVVKKVQGSGRYPGVDNWRDVTLPKGKIIYSGEPGGAGFYTTKRALERSGGKKDKLWQELQVAPHPEMGYRSKIGIYEVIDDVPAAFGTAKANPMYGRGTSQQIFIENGEKLRKVGEITLNK